MTGLQKSKSFSSAVDDVPRSSVIGPILPPGLIGPADPPNALPSTATATAKNAQARARVTTTSGGQDGAGSVERMGGGVKHAPRPEQRPESPRNRHEHVTKRRVFPGYRRGMDEARAVLARLERIEALEARGAPAGRLLDEVRGLLAEAEAWVRTEREGTDLAESALERCREALHAAEDGDRERLKSVPFAAP
jgi:hypothetical protein